MLNKPLDKWTELDYLRRAYINALDFSDDYSTQNGSVLVPDGQHSTQISFGSNHFPGKLKATPGRLLDRHLKLAYMQHAERDAIFKSARNGIPTEGATLYCPWFACEGCAKAIIGAGIKRVVGHQPMMERTPLRWRETILIADEMLDEEGVVRDYYEDDLFDGDPAYQVLFNGSFWIP